MNSGLPYTPKEANSYKNVWPSFIQTFLSDSKAREIYGGEELWKYIPTQLRGWWIWTITNIDDFQNVNIDTPPSKFNDISDSLVEFQSDINSYELNKLISCTNKVCMCV